MTRQDAEEAVAMAFDRKPQRLAVFEDVVVFDVHAGDTDPVTGHHYADLLLALKPTVFEVRASGDGDHLHITCFGVS